MTGLFFILPTEKKKLSISELISEFWLTNETKLDNYFSKKNKYFFTFYEFNADIFIFDEFKQKSNAEIFSEINTDSYPVKPWPVCIDFVAGTDDMPAYYWVNEALTKLNTLSIDQILDSTLAAKIRNNNSKIVVDFSKSPTLAAEVALLFIYQIAKSLNAVIKVVDFSPSDSLLFDRVFLCDNYLEVIKKELGKYNPNKTYG